MKPFNGTVDIYHANAGSGKTSTLLDIIESYLDQGIPIERIAFVTFTKKGAEVAQKRIAERFNLPMSRLKNIRTIHSMCFRGVMANREIMMDLQKYREFGEKAGYEFGMLGLDATEGVNWNETKDQRLVSAEQLYRANKKYCERILDDKIDWGELVEYMRLYTQYKRTFGYKDFTDLLDDYLDNGCYEDVDIACLDEMQDSSPLQWRVVFQAFASTQHIYIAGDDKQCQPVGTKVFIQDRGCVGKYINIEDLNPQEHRLRCMKPQCQGGYTFSGGYQFTVEHHPYKGLMYKITTENGKVSRYTPEHLCVVKIRIDDKMMDKWCIYLMKRGNWYRIGISKIVATVTDEGKMLGPSVRARKENAECYWILKIGTQEECRLYEEYWCIKYGIPQIVWEMTNTSAFDPEPLYTLLGDITPSATTLLANLGLDIQQPFIEVGTNYSSGWFVTAARNLIPEILAVPLNNTGHKCHPRISTFSLEKEQYEGEVYSLYVPGPHTYIADGIVTHNCIFRYSGAAPEILLNMKGNQHILDISYRVPSNILKFANNIAKEIQESVFTDCKAKREGGDVIELSEIDDITPYFKPDESWFFLVRNKKFFKWFEEWCIENCIPYKVKGVSYFSNTDKFEFREGKTGDWPKDKLEFAQRCYRAGTFYQGPDVNISTIHTVKGDEADNVVLLSDISKAVAVQYDMDEDSEHRVFYVATTRARYRLFIIQPQTKLYYPWLFQ